jgi:hypothetical protein
MNCTELATSWDAYRDHPEALPQRQRLAIEEHLHSCPTCEALWAQESAWLGDLAAETASAPGSAGGFRGAVLAQWDAAHAKARGPILARLGFLAWPALAAAAAVLLAVLIAPQAPVPTRRPVPLGALVRGLEHSYILRPARLLGLAKTHAAQLASNLDNALSLSPSDIPDPADFFAPAPDAPVPHG